MIISNDKVMVQYYIYFCYKVQLTSQLQGIIRFSMYQVTADGIRKVLNMNFQSNPSLVMRSNNPKSSISRLLILGYQ